MNVNRIPDTGAAWSAAVASHASPAVREKDVPPAGRPPADEVKAAVASANATLADAGRRLEMAWDGDTKRIVVKLVDSVTKEVIRQMPTKEALSLARRLASLAEGFSAEA
jgi:flagellar protein FlaG